MITTINIYSDGTVDCYDIDNCKVKELSGDLEVIHKIIKNYDTCVNYSPRTIPPEERVSQNAIFYFVIANTDFRKEIPYKHIIQLSKYIINKNTTPNSVDEFND